VSIDIRERLGELSMEISQETAEMHLSAIAAELRSPSPIPPRRFRRRRLPIVAVAAAVLVALTAAGAVAAESAVSGDRLYPVKQATEWVRSWVDPTVPADHRIDELEELIDRRAAHEAIADQLQRAEDAVADVSVGDAVIDAPLVDRLHAMRDQARDVIDPAPRITDQPPPNVDSDTPVPKPDREPGDGPADDRGDVPGDREGSLDELCKKVAASDNRAEEFPAWVLRRCLHLLPPPNDSGSP